MTIQMADGPPSNIPGYFNAPGFAVAGYVNMSGIGITYPAIVAKFPNATHLSITTNGSAAQVADVESGAMSDWTGYDYGYCSVSNVNSMVATYGRPRKLWTAHQDPRFGQHICGPTTCNYGGDLVTAADGTQWIDHNGAWDESVLMDDFFDPAPQPPTTLEEGEEMVTYEAGGQVHVIVYQPSRNRTVHYWQSIPGTAPPGGNYDWHSEVMTEPA